MNRRTFWQSLYDALSGNWKPERSTTVGVEWTRDVPPDDEPTEDMIKAETPDWVPPPPAQTDEWRPRTTLDP